MDVCSPCNIHCRVPRSTKIILRKSADFLGGVYIVRNYWAYLRSCLGKAIKFLQ